MKPVSPLSFYLRILVISLVIAFMGLGSHPHALANFFSKANQSIKNDDWLAASSNLAASAEYYPWWFELDLEAARYALRAGDPQAAIRYFERPLAVSHLTNNDLILLGDAYYQAGEPYIAESLWKHVLELDDASLAHERLATLYLQRKDYSNAVAHLEKVLALNPSDIRLYYQVGSLYAATDPPQALPFLVQAVEIDPAHASPAQALHDKIRTATLYDSPAYTFLVSGRQLAQSGQWELAVEAFHRATEVQPQYVEAWAYLGEARQQFDKQLTGAVTTSGLPELEHAVRLDAKSVLANIFMALYWERHEDYAQATVYLLHAIRSSPGDPYLYSELGSLLAKSGDLPAAQAAYESAIQLAPRDPLFYQILAEYALEHQIQIRELALPAARQALTFDPDNASSLDVMAQVMLALRDYHSAERYSLNALHADPTYAPAYLHLGTTYLYLNQPELALQWLNKAKTIDPSSWTAYQAERMSDYYFPER